MPSVSYSEASSYLLCKRKHYYGYTKSLKRVTESDALALGSAGHAVLEAFYRHILEAGETKAAQKRALPGAEAAARVKYDEIMAGGFRDSDKKESLENIIFRGYIPNEPFVSAGWRILAVEQSFRVDVKLEEDSDEVIEMPFVVDLIAFDPEGKTVVIDHKVVYDFYTSDQAQLNPQIPLYIAGLRGLGHKVDYGAYNMLRNRLIRGTKLKDGSYPGPTVEQQLNYLPLKPNAVRVQRTFMEQLDTAQEIQALKELSPEQQGMKAHRVANNMVCKSCSFKDICTTELIGGNVNLMLKTEYVVRERRTFAASVDASDEEGNDA